MNNTDKQTMIAFLEDIRATLLNVSSAAKYIADDIKGIVTILMKEETKEDEDDN